MRCRRLTVRIAARGTMANRFGKARRFNGEVGVMLALIALLAVADLVRAEPPPDQAPVAGDDAAPPLKQRAKAVLGAHCAECRARYGEGVTLDLAALADDPGLIAPKRPDASPAYQRLLAERNERGEGEALPTPDDIEAVRDWIESLPLREESCAGRTSIAPNDVKSLVARWKDLIGAQEAEQTRFVSLAHLWNACVPAARLLEARVATATLLGVLMRRREGLNLETLGDASALLAVKPGEQALLDAGWDALEAEAPTLAYGAVPADWLAAHILARSKDANAPGHLQFDGVAERAVSALARHWTRDVDLVRAAAERGVSPRELKRSLDEAEGALLVPSRRLAYGALGRKPWQRLSAALDSGAVHEIATHEADEQHPGALDIVLWPDASFYRPRDLVSFNVRVDKACYLTLIGVDGAGEAIVLFPNELEPRNLIAPRVTVKVPGHDAGYQFRFDRAGEESVVAICQRHRHRPRGIAYDYDRQRFDILGNWRTFLRTVPKLEKRIVEKRAAEEARRKRRRRPPLDPEPKPLDPDGPPREGRTSIAVTVHPGGTSPD